MRFQFAPRVGQRFPIGGEGEDGSVSGRAGNDFHLVRLRIHPTRGHENPSREGTLLPCDEEHQRALITITSIFPEGGLFHKFLTRSKARSPNDGSATFAGPAGTNRSAAISEPSALAERCW